MKSFIIWLKIEVFRFLREPISLFFTLIFPIILVFIFGDSFGSSVSEDGISYYNSLVAIDVSFFDRKLYPHGCWQRSSQPKRKWD